MNSKMPRLGWQDIEPIYAVTAFADDGTGTLTITTQPILNALLLIDQDEDAAADAGMALLTERDQVELGKQAHVQFNAPRTSHGRFALSFANLIAGPKARVEEPANYFVVDGRLTRHSQPPSDLQLRYRSVLSLVALLARAAAFLDGVQQELVFFRDGRIAIPVNYDEKDLTSLKADQVAKLVGLFADPVHLEQKLTILSEAVIDLVAGLPTGQRFRHVMRGVGEIVEKVAAGYRLFASSFTYSKIRREVETAQAEFITRIHKTFVDLQGQILGIPIATIVVASQLKVAKACGVEVWTNIAVIAGAWIFVLFLLASIVNQWLTLKAIAFEFGRQQDRLVKDFAEVRGDFNTAFEQLTNRAFWHRVVFVVVGLIGVGGASFATWAATKLIEVEIHTCI
ncbi:hypothetical protein EN851_22255 [Mesorhizobium sp. M8A.F.Ca.ET.208.01.1.1]|uniref:hypothetical protein n=2 Tax=Mesorhizobium TaxID=68287 RepID=UPI0010936822|nr:MULTISPECIES: hypothetical protein [unclassified Mesorhizobium]TGQ89029.1 hypothetical protein EN851_22255 [Mesorhizobium sp. M8A.F.Ca.ET.208.01.1.1]TGR32133.1 hypothetical protein EN845_06070 [Mesorhizobium sp. M8A.F.Ca.ET.202.01.1.1]TGT50348.1 hypothetical protein EN810_22155 [Mesorhizobium sp. M8A.F.Ca.ET.167.01.1.1]TGU40010.1 hypothetical protein EN799_06070 [bacterium M00.F.Ca.ET.156.01.1.1]